MPVQILEQGNRNIIVKITNDASATFDPALIGIPTATRLGIKRVWFSIISGGVIALDWEATANVNALTFPGHCDDWNFEEIGALWNNAGAGVTGKLILTATAAASYTVILWLEKHGNININNA